MQLVEWIRGSSSKISTLLRQNASSSATFGSGRNFGFSAEAWRFLIRQAWLSGFIHRDMKRGVGKMMSMQNGKMATMANKIIIICDTHGSYQSL